MKRNKYNLNSSWHGRAPVLQSMNFVFRDRFEKNPVPLNLHANFGSNGRLEFFRFA